MTLSTRLWKLPKSTSKKQNIYNILLINMTQSCQIKQIYISLASCIYLNNTCLKHNFKSVHVSNLFWSREYNSAKEICKYTSFSKVGGNYPLDLKIIWSSVGIQYDTDIHSELSLKRPRAFFISFFLNLY
jgi:hypothetical protein